MADKSSTRLPGTVENIIPVSDVPEPEKAEIAVEGAEDFYKEIRVQNSLTTESGNKVRLKKGAEVEVTVKADSKATTPKNES
jgi:fibrillarin-like rRNA methylase